MERNEKGQFIKGAGLKDLTGKRFGKLTVIEGDMHVSVGDYIIRGIDGELYPCKHDIFEKTYEAVE